MQTFRILMPIVLSAIMLLMDWYVFTGIKSLYKNKKSKWLKAVKYIFWQTTVICFIFMLYFLTNPVASHLLKTLAGGGIFVLYLCKLFFIIFLLVDDIRRLLVWIRSLFKPTPAAAVAGIETEVAAPASNKISRKDFIVKTGLIATAAPLILFTRGITSNTHNYRVHKKLLKINNLPSAFRGLKIVQVSDIHSGSFIDSDGVAKGVRMIKALQPDLIFFTGDLVNNSTDEAYEWMDILSEIKAPMGVLSTLGNHDYGDYREWPSDEAKQANFNDLVKVHADLGWHLMRNEHVTLDLHGQRIGIIGVENWGHQKRFQKFGDLAKATANMPDVPVKLLLSHDPSHWDLKVRQETPDIDVMFAGHTHGFQFGIETPYFKFSPSQWVYKQWAGLYQEGNQQLYVNRGFGFLGYPGRVGILPEITLIELA